MKIPKIGDTVIITKPGLFNGCKGEVLANNPDIKNSLTVVLGDTGGTWSFSYADIQPTKDNSTQAPKSNPTPEIVKDVIEVLKEVGFQEVKPAKKRGRKPKGEVKPIVHKRKYTRKEKK